MAFFHSEIGSFHVESDQTGLTGDSFEPAEPIRICRQIVVARDHDQLANDAGLSMEGGAEGVSAFFFRGQPAEIPVRAAVEPDDRSIASCLAGWADRG